MDECPTRPSGWRKPSGSAPGSGRYATEYQVFPGVEGGREVSKKFTPFFFAPLYYDGASGNLSFSMSVVDVYILLDMCPPRPSAVDQSAVRLRGKSGILALSGRHGV